MHAKQWLKGLAAVAALGLALGAQAKVVVKQTAAVAPAAAVTVAAVAATPAATPAAGPGVWACLQRPTKVGEYLCLCRKGVDLPRCPPSGS